MSELHRVSRCIPRQAIAAVVAAAILASHTAHATTYVSAEPVPSRNVIGEENLARIRSIGYLNLEHWSRRLLYECRVVDQVIDALSADGAISTVVPGSNTHFVVAAGGFEAITNPSFVFTVQDHGAGAVAAADIDVLNNALGYVLSQAETAHFSPDNARAYSFALDYALVTFSGMLTGEEARAFFDHLGTVDPALWSGLFAGFTQIDLPGSLTNNTMLFLQPAVNKVQFVSGLSRAAADDPRASYAPLKVNGEPTTARAGVAFPGNDWLTYPNGDGYLVNIGGSPHLLNALAALRRQHLVAVADLLRAIDRGKVDLYLNNQFRCAS